jgi:hypothetical protein
VLRRSIFGLPLLLSAQQPEFLCPMDRDVRQPGPGKCPRCGMKLVAGLPDFREYPVALSFVGPAARAGNDCRMRFVVRDPKTKQPVRRFEWVHERLFHLFLISEDRQCFAHEHPEVEPDGSFTFDWRFPAPGLWRLLYDFYPVGGLPQMVTKSIYVPGPPAQLPTAPDPPDVQFRTEPSLVRAGEEIRLLFTLNKSLLPMEQYLGAWGHLLAASEDLIDLVHTHPFLTSEGERVQFNLNFPRTGKWRLWAQFQSRGKVITFPCDVSVEA